MSNWLERRHHRDLTIAARDPELWIELCAAIKESVGGFNEYYGSERPIVFELNKGRLKLTKQHALSDLVPPHLAAQSTTEFSHGEYGVQVVRTIPRPGSIPNTTTRRWEFRVDANDNGEVFFKYGDRTMSPDAVAQEILED
jgi:hypothetical protein